MEGGKDGNKIHRISDELETKLPDDSQIVFVGGGSDCPWVVSLVVWYSSYIYHSSPYDFEAFVVVSQLNMHKIA